MEKRLLNEQEKDSQPSQPPHPSSWRTGFWRRFPHSGIFALVTALAASVSMIYIITASDGQPITSWKYQPTVCLAISYTIANIALQYALAQAVTIAWWAKALKGDAKVKDLHDIWAFGHGVFPILRSGRGGGPAGWRVMTTGTTVLGYLADFVGKNGSIELFCNMSLPDPTPNVLKSLREIAFRMALYIPHSRGMLFKTDIERSSLQQWPKSEREEGIFQQTIEVEQTATEIVFKSQYQFLAIAIGITLVATACVFTVLAGWWHLGREVSLSPIEIAKAFNAPLLAESHPNAEVRRLLKECGEQRLSAHDEKLVQFLTSSTLDETNTSSLLKTFCRDMEQPVYSSLGGRYKYRSADGSNNNIHLPNVGKAGSYYARMVTPRHIPTKLPDPELLFDTLLAREAKPKLHPTQLSSLFFAFAAVMVCDVFRTGDEDNDVAMTSSYLDLSSLYGESEESQSSVRTFVDGKLKPDAFADTRILSRPAASSALIVCFSRFHNIVVEQLAIINENGRFSPPCNAAGIDTGFYKRALSKRDNDLFQTARLVTTGLYINIVLKDYVRTILNLQCVDSSVTSDPRAKIEGIIGQTDVDKARGNQTSAEINMIYRWHSTISKKDEDWLTEHMSMICPDMKIGHLTLEDMRAGMRRHAAIPPADPGRRVFAGLERKNDGYFRDEDIVQILTEATDEVAMSFGPHRVPLALKVIEVMSIEQGRQWGVASLNETRRFFGMTSHTSFSDIHSDPDVAAALEVLYEDVENVELYAGTILEEPTAPMTPGSGLCAGTTATRAVVSHALSLIRGDRFYTVDYTPHHLTAFGFNAASSEYSIDGGGVMYKLLMRVFPEYYRGNSIYAHYPLTTPVEMRRRQKSLGHETDFCYEKPRYGSPPTVITDYKMILRILRDQTLYTTAWTHTLRQLEYQPHVLLGNTIAAVKQQDIIRQAILGPEESIEIFAHFLNLKTTQLVQNNSKWLFKVAEIDAIKDVAARSWTQFAACLFNIPISDSQDSTASFDDKQLFSKMIAVFHFVHLDNNPAKSAALRRDAITASDEMSKEVRVVCEGMKASPAVQFPDPRKRRHAKRNLMPDHGAKVMQRLFDNGAKVKEVVSLVVILAVDLVVFSTFAFCQIIDLFLSEPYHSTHWPDIQKLAKDITPANSEVLRAYVLEALRLITPATGFLRIPNTFLTTSDWRHAEGINKGDDLILDVATASRDPAVFPDPDNINLDRPQELYLPFIDGLHGALTRPIIVAGLVTQLRIFARMEGLRKGPGTQETLRREVQEGTVSFLSEAKDEWVPLPVSKYIFAT
ncbi:hypothetical protein J4E83_004238 [Alternaria metachromatica]|uniref:uncharacterized protein n=1 Tax=Alternaria metachromatica TaxID=283354 RepID=UPI0020C42E44|nr:uncharacterized protein J4E83_004238 [Alternaria metachromatica]KAI4624563.1 hypothetical protein J4E83_004238 [Alternaria metachromatica]